MPLSNIVHLCKPVKDKLSAKQRCELMKLSAVVEEEQMKQVAVDAQHDSGLQMHDLASKCLASQEGAPLFFLQMSAIIDNLCKASQFPEEFAHTLIEICKSVSETNQCSAFLSCISAFLVTMAAEQCPIRLKKDILEMALDHVTASDNVKMHLLHEKTSMKRALAILFTIGDWEIQYSLLELLFRICPRDINEKKSTLNGLLSESLSWAVLPFDSQELVNDFVEISAKAFPSSIRKLLNKFNGTFDCWSHRPKPFACSMVQYVSAAASIDIRVDKINIGNWIDINKSCLSIVADIEGETRSICVYFDEISSYMVADNIDSLAITVYLRNGLKCFAQLDPSQAAMLKMTLICDHDETNISTRAFVAEVMQQGSVPRFRTSVCMAPVEFSQHSDTLNEIIVQRSAKYLLPNDKVHQNIAQPQQQATVTKYSSIAGSFSDRSRLPSYFSLVSDVFSREDALNQCESTITDSSAAGLSSLQKQVIGVFEPLATGTFAEISSKSACDASSSDLSVLILPEKRWSRASFPDLKRPKIELHDDCQKNHRENIAALYQTCESAIAVYHSSERCVIEQNAHQLASHYKSKIQRAMSFMKNGLLDGVQSRINSVDKTIRAQS